MTDVSLLPPSATTQEISLANTVARISDIPVPNGDLYNPATCPAAMLPWLAWAFSVDEWNPAWAESQKRQAIANSVYVHRHKGTIGALKSAIGALGFDLAVQEWQQLVPQGDPYTFGLTLTIDDVGISSPGDFENIYFTAESAKNARSHMTFFDIDTTRSGTMLFGGVPFYGTTITIPADGDQIIETLVLNADGTYSRVLASGISSATSSAGDKTQDAGDGSTPEKLRDMGDGTVAEVIVGA